MYIDFTKLYAHIDQKDSAKKQLLIDHLKKTGEGAAKIAEQISLSNMARISGLLHDIGKIDDNFQNKLAGTYKKHVDHSSLGGYIVVSLHEIICNKYQCNNTLNITQLSYYTNILLYTITSHHGQYDLIRKNSENKYILTLVSRIEKIKSHYQKKGIDDIFTLLCTALKDKDIDIIALYEAGYCEYKEIFNKLKELAKAYSLSETLEAFDFYQSLFTRLLLSILKASDIKDTINSYEENIVDDRQEDLDSIKKQFLANIEEKYRELQTPDKLQSKINQARNKIAENILVRASIDKVGIYKLDLPTGAGKTMLSLRYGMNQLVKQKKQRFFYITSYLAVLEQNAQEIRSILQNDDFIIEHHSNIFNEEEVKDEVMEQDEKDDSLVAVKREFLFNNWNKPVVLTTMVEFFNTFFKGKVANITRLHAFINSVIILDELQSLPREVLYMTNLTLNFLKVAMNATIILSTATQPTYDFKTLKHKLAYGDNDGKDIDILHFVDEEQIFERVNLKIFNDGQESTVNSLMPFILDNRDKSILIILNTKQVVRTLYDELLKEIGEEDVYYLTTNLHAHDRLEKIATIKNRLVAKKNIIVIATPLIEAGVDVDFQLVIRSYAGMDAIVQAMGRCNREGHLSKGETYLVNIEEQLESMQSLLQERQATKYVIKEEYIKKSVRDLKALKDVYFSKLYINPDSHNDSNNDDTLYRYPLSDSSNMLDLLGKNIYYKKILIQKKGTLPAGVKYHDKCFYNNNLCITMLQSFKKAYESFDLIADRELRAIVECDETKDILDAIEQYLASTYDKSKYKKIKHYLNKLNRYTVPIKREELIFTESLDDGLIYVVDSNFYNHNTGIDFHTSETFML